MAIYFFDTRDGDKFIAAELAVDLPDLKAVKVTAAASLAELARDVLPGSSKRVLIVEARDEHGLRVLEARLTFEAVILAANTS